MPTKKPATKGSPPLQQLVKSAENTQHHPKQDNSKTKIRTFQRSTGHPVLGIRQSDTVQKNPKNKKIPK
jgi:pterin-4a-carbinolamine dehydratase